MKKFLLTAVFIIALAASIPAYLLYDELKKVESNDPLVWDEIVKELIKKTEAENPPADVVLFVGSSSIRFWDSLKQDMAPMPVIQYGFGGAKIYDVVYYAEALITRWQAPKLVIFVGSNDINSNEQHQMAPAYIGEQLKTLFDIIFAEKPDTKVFYIAITPTLYSWDKWSSVQEANRIAAAVCDDYENATFIDPTSSFLDAQGKPNKDFFVFDGLHLNEKGYALWTSHIKPYLL